MEITPQMVKELREKTSAGMMDCKKALTESGGDMEAAIVVLRKKGQASAEKKATRIASEGMIGHYIHMGEKLLRGSERGFSRAGERYRHAHRGTEPALCPA